jgi:2-polyprenyl-6-methoxyphenol hydroxylase-like FAD-dependent oxidoreductase
MKCSVIIAGGGPNGLLMACELALAGVRSIVLERLEARSTMPKANGLVGQIVQALDYRGLFERFTGSAGPPRPAPGFQFGALALEDQPIYIAPVPQRRIEEILELRAIELGAEVRRGHEVVSVSQDADGVTIDVSGPSGLGRMTTEYLVAADGGRSAIRKQLGIGFPGITDDSFVGLNGQASFATPTADPETGELDVPGLGRLRSGTFTRTERGMFAYGTFQPGVHRFAVYEWNRPRIDDSVPVTLAEARETVSRVLGAEVSIVEPVNGAELMLRRSEGINSRQAERYRVGRVFLIGDAAHVHSGIGGPGLNLGMQDVLNLGWKLGAQIKGWAPAGLLDTYERERHPVGARVLMQTRAQMALLSPGPNVTALRQLVEELLRNRDNVRHIGEMMSGSDVRYAMGSSPSRAHRLTGTWMPDLTLRTEKGSFRVAERMRSARPILVDLAGSASLVAAAHEWNDRVDIVRATAESDAAAVLIRPDGYVAWASDLPHAADGLRDALERWFGPPLHDPIAACA